MKSTFRSTATAVAVATGLILAGQAGPAVGAAPALAASAPSTVHLTATTLTVAHMQASAVRKVRAASVAQARYKTAAQVAARSASMARARAVMAANARAAVARGARGKAISTAALYQQVAVEWARTAHNQAILAARAKASAAAAAKAATAAKAAATKAAADKAAAAKAAAAAAAAASSSSAATETISGVSADSAMPTGDVASNGRTWKQTYAQDFDTPAALGSFSSVYPGIGTYSGFKDTSGLGLYSPNKVLSVSNGNLDFNLHSENGQPLVATILPDDYAAHTTGRVSIRYKATQTRGYKFVGMFWPSDDKWNEGEIDWPEADLGATPRPVSAMPGTLSNAGMKFMPANLQFADSDTTAYHVATTEWDRKTVRFYWDGRLVSNVSNAVPDTAMRVTLQAETWIGEGAVPANAAGHLDIDWISIWD